MDFVFIGYFLSSCFCFCGGRGFFRGIGVWGHKIGHDTVVKKHHLLADWIVDCHINWLQSFCFLQVPNSHFVFISNSKPLTLYCDHFARGVDHIWAWVLGPGKGGGTHMRGQYRYVQRSTPPFFGSLAVHHTPSCSLLPFWRPQFSKVLDF